MKKIYLLVIILSSVLLVGVGAFFFSLKSQLTTTNPDVEKEIDYLQQNRPEGATDKPNLTKNITDIRLSVVPRKTYTADFLDSTDRYKGITLLQTWYGYCSDGQWHDVPSDNYDLVGIMNNAHQSGWEAATGSHMVKIGPYVLICVVPGAYLDRVCRVSDTLGTEVQEPFAEYFTYYSYTDENGNVKYYLDDHDSGYGTIAENVEYKKGDKGLAFQKQATFAKRYYLILEWKSLSEDYQLNVSIEDSQRVRTYELCYSEMQELLGLG